jgi:hypothetical protein
MTDRPANKAVGIRIPIALWDKLEAYGLEHHPKAEGFDLTQSMVTLMANALDMPLDEIVKRPSGSEDVRSLIEQALIPIQNHTQLLNEGFDEFRGELGYVRSALEATAPKELLADIMNRIDRLEAAINGKSQSKSRTSATTTETPQGGNRFGFKAFAKEHGLDIEREDSAEEVWSALEAAGLSDRYRYDSTVKAFYEY